MYGPLSPEELIRLQSLPVINRAKGHRLYASDGSRWIDCWADGGRALLGHRPGNVSLRLKNEIDKGLYAPYPNRWTKRLEHALHRLFPGYKTMRVFSTLDRALEHASFGQWPADPLDLPSDPPTMISPVWGRPLLPGHPASCILFPILPVPGIDLQPVLFFDSPASLPPSDPVSPLWLAALTRACLAVAHTFYEPPCSLEGQDLWELRGPYMLWQGKDTDYMNLFEKLISRSVLISPACNRPSLLPLGLSMGEMKKIFN